MFDFFKKSGPPSEIRVRPTVLLILDGWGIAPPSFGNAIDQAKKPNMDMLLEKYPHGELIASGESVGLPANEVGNTEVGHLTIGSGRTILQSLKRISVSIEDGSFFENKAFMDAYQHTVKNNSTLHIMGILSSGNVHGSANHMYKLLDFFKRLKAPKVCLHIFTDGRDSSPKESREIVAKLEQYLASLKMGKIATIGGRYYAMDRDRRWDRTQKAYDAMVMGKGKTANSATEAIDTAYAGGLTDEFIEPTIIVSEGRPVGLISDGDAVVFSNFRIDRPRQLTMAFVLPNFEDLKGFELGYQMDEGRMDKQKVKGLTFKREKIVQNLFFVTMTEYQENLPVSAIAFPRPNIQDSMSEVLSKNNIKHLHMAESEKERMVTYYFAGLRDEKFVNEEHLIVPSPKIAGYDKKPEMSVFKLVNEFEKAVNRQEYQFIVINFANADMVGHTGNLTAAIKACEAVDKALGRVIKKVLDYDGTLVVTADHGNAEGLLSYPTGTFFYTTSQGEMNTDHSNNPVPVIFVGKKFEGVTKAIPKGTLADISPTILKMMGLPVPEAMKGQDLLVQ